MMKKKQIVSKKKIKKFYNFQNQVVVKVEEDIKIQLDLKK